MSKESEEILGRILDYLQRDWRIRLAIGAVLIAVFLGFAGRLAWGLVPHQATLRITGGDIVNNNHYLARVLQKETPKVGVDLVVQPEPGGLASLEALSRGDVDLAFVPGGLDRTLPNVEHVAMVTTELIHLLVRPGIKTVADLKGRRLNLGARNSSTREIVLKITAFAGYTRGVDFVETNYSNEELLALPERRMPDAIFWISSVPSYLVELLVKTRGYGIMEIAFPQSLALRYGWAAGAQILSYTYDLAPPIPDKDISTVAVNMYLLANTRADPAAVEKVLEVLYSPSVASAARTTFDEAKMATASGYPISTATTLYQQRNASILTAENWGKLQGVFGLVMSLSGMGIVLVKWFRGPPPKVDFDDKEFLDYMATVVQIEEDLRQTEEHPPFDRAKIVLSRDTLSVLRVKVLQRYATAKLKDAQLFEQCIASVRACHDRTVALLDKAPS